MTRFGYALSSEEHAPTDLVRHAALAEEAGFEFALISDHYHVTHHHTGGPLGEFEHRAHYHAHEHNHAPLVHGHDHDPAKEDDDHGKEAHVHDHNEPAGEGR